MPTCVSAKGWQRGIKSDVRLAAIKAAIRATPNTSPNPAGGDGNAPGILFGTDVNHMRLAGGIKVGERGSLIVGVFFGIFHGCSCKSGERSNGEGIISP